MRFIQELGNGVLLRHAVVVEVLPDRVRERILRHAPLALDAVKSRFFQS